MKTETKVWATSVEYEKVHAYLEDRGIDSTNEYHYVNLLESKGLKVYRADLRDWMKANQTVIDTKGFEL